jgi:hypothetical protein
MGRICADFILGNKILKQIPVIFSHKEHKGHKEIEEAICPFVIFACSVVQYFTTLLP